MLILHFQISFHGILTGSLIFTVPLADNSLSLQADEEDRLVYTEKIHRHFYLLYVVVHGYCRSS